MTQLCLLEILFLIMSMSVGASPASNHRHESWEGHYWHAQGKRELLIEEIEPGLIGIEIIDIEHPGLPMATFLARTKGDKAENIFLHPDPECRIEFVRSTEIITLFDYCGGPGDDAGQYRLVSK